MFRVLFFDQFHASSGIYSPLLVHMLCLYVYLHSAFLAIRRTISRQVVLSSTHRAAIHYCACKRHLQRFIHCMPNPKPQTLDPNSPCLNPTLNSHTLCRKTGAGHVEVVQAPSPRGWKPGTLVGGRHRRNATEEAVVLSVVEAVAVVVPWRVW